MTEKENFINNVKNNLKELGWTQKMFADKIGCSKTTISKWFLFQTQPTLEYVIKICKVLNCTFEELIS